MRLISARSAFTALLGLVVLSCTDSPASPRRIGPGGALADQTAPAPGRIVVSQIYGGGGNAGSVYRNDFIELFNAGGTAVDVTGWSVQYSSSGATANFGIVSSGTGITSLSGTIAPGAYYLVQEAAGTGTTQPLLPTPDASGAIAMSATSARVLIAKSAAAVGVPCPAASNPNIVDVVSYGSNGVACGLAAPTLANGTAAFRANGGCPPAAGSPDFMTTPAAPTPRNKSSALNQCPGTGSTTTTAPAVASIMIAGPTSMTVGDTKLFTASVLDDQNNPITPTPSVTWHSSATAAVDINPTSGSATAVSAGSTPPTHVTITATSDNGVTSNPIDVTVSVAPVFTDRSGQVVISQIYGGGGNNGATFKNDFIELFNPGAAPIDLTGWSVQQTSAMGTSWNVTPLAGTIPAGAYYLVQEAAGTGGAADLPTPDATGTIAMGAASGKVLLAQTTTAASVSCPSGAMYVDVVSYSGGNCGGSTGTTANTTAAIRWNGGCLYTGDPSKDFKIGTPTPHNSSRTRSCVIGPLDLVGVSGTTSILVGGTTQLTASAFDADSNVIVPVTPTWTTSDASIATVSSTGLVTGVGANSTPAAITASVTVNGVTKTASLDVAVNNPGGINWLDISYSADSIPPGFQAQMFITARDASGGTVIPATFTVEALDPGIATAINLPTGTIVQGVAAPAVTGTFPRFKITATPTGGSNTTAYVFTSGKSTSIPVTAPASAGSSIYSKNDELGDPTAASANTPDDFLIKRDQYTISYNQTRGTPNWVAYELDHRQAPGSIDRCNCFTADPALPMNKQIFTSDYTNGGYDRGHMERSADRTAAILDNAATFYLSNVVPQAGDLNQGVWAQFENALGDSARAGRAVYVIVGPLYTHGKALTWLNADKNQTKVAIPDSTWKVAVIGPMNGNTPFTLASLQSWTDMAGLTVLAVNMPNVSGVRNDPWQKYLTTVHKIEQSTGYNFLSLIPAAFQSAVEADDHAPVARFAMSGTPSEGNALAFDASASTDQDIGRNDMERTDALTYTWHFSDGSMSSGKTVTKVFADNGSFTASLTVTDAFGWESTTIQTVTVSNLAPSATFVTPVAWPATEGATFTLQLAQATDPSSIDAASLTFAFDCGMGYGSPRSGATVTCQVQDNGVTKVRAKVLDKDGGFAEYQASFETSNVAPTATFSAVAGNETSPITLSASGAADPSSADVAAGFTFAFDCGTGFGAPSTTATASCPTTTYGSRSVGMRVFDKDGGSTSYTQTVTVGDIAPIVAAFDGAQLLQGETFTIASSFTDPGAETWTGTVSFGDGASAVLTLNGKTFQTNHVYTAAGSFTAKATINDGQLAASASGTVLVQTPSQGVDNLSDAVDALDGLGMNALRAATSATGAADKSRTSLDNGDLKQLHGKLDNAKDQIAKANRQPATNQLQQFIADLQKDANDGKLSNAAIAPIVAYAQRVIVSINR